MISHTNNEPPFSQVFSPEILIAESVEFDQEIDDSLIIDPVAISAARRAIRATGREPSRWAVTQKRPPRRVVVRRIRAIRARAVHSSVAHGGAQKAADDSDGSSLRPSHTAACK
jgi:hypothetical protein